MNLLESITHVATHKHLPNVLAKKEGVSTFDEITSLISNGKLDNKLNRDEELETKYQYLAKASHVIRYVSGISSKGQLLISVLKNNTSKDGYIRDCGTFFGMISGDYFDSKVLTGTEWLLLFDDICEEYGVDYENRFFIIMIEDYLNGLSLPQLDLKYSIEDLLNKIPEAQEFWNNTTYPFVVNLMTVKQHNKDMINCNKQPNPWEAYNFYIIGNKHKDEYKYQFLGDDLLKYFSDKVGTSQFKAGKLMYSYKKEADRKKCNKLVPIYIAYCVSKYCKTIDELNNAYSMIVSFTKHDNKDVSKYWVDMFEKMVKETEYSDMVDFYENQYEPMFKNTNWDTITQTINSIVTKHLNGKETTAMSGLHIKKYDTGMWFLTTALWFKQNNKSKSSNKLITQIVNSYVNLLSGTITYEGTPKKIYEYFGTEASTIKSTSANVRMDTLFQYVTKNVEKWIKDGSKDRDDEAKYRVSSLNKLKVFVEENCVSNILYLYPLSTDVFQKINIVNGDGLHWLHKSPHCTGGKAVDGFLGMIDDNLDTNVKYMNWNCTPNEYWEMVIDRNEKMVATLDGIEQKRLKKSISILEEMVDLDLTA